jgi:hypothetical protein
MPTSTKLNEKPIIFSTPMVKAILDGRKTQTRRLIKPPPDKPFATKFNGFWAFDNDGKSVDVGVEFRKCPYGQAGDLLWVRETLWVSDCGQYYVFNPFPPYPKMNSVFIDNGVSYLAIYYGSLKPSPHYAFELGFDVNGQFIKAQFHKRKPSIFMPRKYSRLTLEITEIRVQRLQEISHEDITAEAGGGYHDIGWNYAYGQLWNSINEKRGYGWDVNPWVWAISFKVLVPNQR